MELIVLSKPKCRQCKMLKKYLESHGVKYTPIDIVDMPEAIEKYGLSQLPVSVLEIDGVEHSRVQGFRPEQVVGLTKAS